MVIGITGTFEGWVPDPTDLYYKGAINDGILAKYESTEIRWKWELERIYAVEYMINWWPYAKFTKAIDVRSFTKLLIKGAFTRVNQSGIKHIMFGIGFNFGNPSNLTTLLPNVLISSDSPVTYYAVVFDISHLSTIPANCELAMGHYQAGCYISQIRLE